MLKLLPLSSFQIVCDQECPVHAANREDSICKLSSLQNIEQSLMQEQQTHAAHQVSGCSGLLGICWTGSQGSCCMRDMKACTGPCGSS